MRETTYKNYLLALLMAILASNFLDRLALGVVLQDIKLELAVSDTQLGLLGGLAFAAFYALMGIPIARWADRGNRVTIITLTTALWSIAVALCGVAGSFAQLLLIRVAVAVGEAGCIPTAHSLTADSFTRSERPRAVGIYTMGAPLSVIIGFFAAGWLNQLYGWRATFVILGLPGVLLAALAWFTLREPRRLTSRPPRQDAELRISEVATTLWGNMTFRHMLLCMVVSQFFMYGVVQWLPAFFVRTYGLQTGELGTWFALTAGVGGLLGNYLGGTLATRIAAGNERMQLRGTAVAWGLHGALSAAMYLMPNQYLAFTCLAVNTLMLAATNGPFLATMQTLVPPRMRATSVALVYLFTNLIGMGLGPVAVGALSDALRPLVGEESLRYALLTLTPGFAWCMWQMWHASKTVTRDVAAREEEGEREEFAVDAHGSDRAVGATNTQ
jgi:predicted MFS family arabinose efflux permease